MLQHDGGVVATSEPSRLWRLPLHHFVVPLPLRGEELDYLITGRLIIEPGHTRWFAFT